ncbi:MAG: hypothetical protein ACJAV4_000516, partial [Pontimonas sp.]
WVKPRNASPENIMPNWITPAGKKSQVLSAIPSCVEILGTLKHSIHLAGE